MKLALFQEVLDLNQAFEQVMRGLAKLEKVRAFSTEQTRRVRAEVETTRVDANREFFDNFDAMVEDDASWSYKFQREYDRKTKDLDACIPISKTPKTGARRRACHHAWRCSRDGI